MKSLQGALYPLSRFYKGTDLNMSLASRKEKILTSILEEYIWTAQPVGSARVSKQGVKASPATIRNEMAELEEMGFLEQPYTSAGRVPTHKAFRYYVDLIVDRLYPLEEDKSQLGSISKTALTGQNRRTIWIRKAATYFQDMIIAIT